MIQGIGFWEFDHISQFRDLLRNGLYHLGYPKKNLLIHNSPTIPTDIAVCPVREEEGAELYVGVAYLANPHRMTHSLVEHFGQFIRRLRGSEPLRRKFEEFWEFDHS